MSDIFVEDNIEIASNVALNWNEVFNKIKPNLKEFYYESSLNNFFNCFILLSQFLCSRSSSNNIKDTKIYMRKVNIKKYGRRKFLQ